MLRLTRRIGLVMVFAGEATLARAPVLLAAQPDSSQPSSAEQAAVVLLERGAHYEQQGRRAAALRAYTDAVQLAPTSQRALGALAQARWELGDYREAESLYRRLAALGDRSEQVVARLAFLAEHRGGTQEAQRLRATLCWAKSGPAGAGEARDRTVQFRACERLAKAYEQEKHYLAALQVWRFIRSHSLSSASTLDVQIAALEMLASELDPVLAGKTERGWVRHMLYRHRRWVTR